MNYAMPIAEARSELVHLVKTTSTTEHLFACGKQWPRELWGGISAPRMTPNIEAATCGDCLRAMRANVAGPVLMAPPLSRERARWLWENRTPFGEFRVTTELKAKRPAYGGFVDPAGITLEEDTGIRAYWQTLPGHFSYADTILFLMKLEG